MPSRLPRSDAPDPVRCRDVLSAYVALTKPRIIELLLVTTVPAMFLAAGGVPPLPLVLVTLVGGCLAAASANVFNCVLDRDIDEQMRRTRRRPLPRHAVSPAAATAFGFVLGLAATLWLGYLRQLAVGRCWRWPRTCSTSSSTRCA